MLTLFPPIKAYKTHHLAVEKPHELYVEESGNPKGIPVLFVHGGPGAGTVSDHRRYFDPEQYHIILFDQRGCGKSTPHASLENNTTQALVSDMEAIREYLGIDQWMLFGGSWGSTLSLVYAETHPDKVLALILRGIFLCRDEDVHWFYQSGAHNLFPDYWEDFQEVIPKKERGEMVSAYYKRLTGNDDLARMAAAKAWSIWEGRCLNLRPNTKMINFFSDPRNALSIARIECHYFINHAFMKENQILKNIDKIKDIPGVIIHGRYDVVCTPASAWELHKAWPKAEIKIIGSAGHAGNEPGIVDALVYSTNSFAKLFR